MRLNILILGLLMVSISTIAIVPSYGDFLDLENHVEPMNVAGAQNLAEGGWVTEYLFSGNMQGTNGAVTSDVVVDPEFGVYTVGYFIGTMNLDEGISLISEGGLDIFVIKSAGPNLIWATSYGGSGIDYGVNIEYSDEYGVIISAVYSSGASLNCDAITCGMVAMLTPDSGEWVFKAKIYSDELDAEIEISDIEVYDEGVYVSGYAFGEFEFPYIQCEISVQGSCPTIDRTENYDGFFAKLIIESSKNIWQHRWSGIKTLAYSGYDDIEAIRHTDDGEIIIGGTFTGTLNFGEQTVSSLDDETYSYYLASYDSEGNPQWISHSTAPTGDSSVTAMDLTADGKLIVVGLYTGNIQFGIETHSTRGSSDMFILKFEQSGELVWAETLGSTGEDKAYTVDVGINGAIFVAMSVASSVVDIPQEGYGLTFTHNGLKDIFVAKFLADGTFMAGQIIGSDGDDEAYGLSIDIDGDLYVVGYTSGEADFGMDWISPNREQHTPYLAIYYQDADWDGLNDYWDACPLIPDISWHDTDGDGLLDTWNQPNLDEDVDGDACDSDIDNDGIINDFDQCPYSQVEYFSSLNPVVVDSTGCVSDSDGDWVVDELDMCPNSSLEYAIDWYGCSSMEYDSDGDGIVDRSDYCGSTPDGASIDDEGCTKIGYTLAGPVCISVLFVLLVGGFIVAQRRFGQDEIEIEFATNKHQIHSVSNNIKGFTKIEVFIAIIIILICLFMSTWNSTAAGVLLIGAFIVQLAWFTQSSNSQPPVLPIPKQNLGFQQQSVQQYHQPTYNSIPPPLPTYQQPVLHQKQPPLPQVHPTQEPELDDLLSDLFDED